MKQSGSNPPRAWPGLEHLAGKTTAGRVVLVGAGVSASFFGGNCFAHAPVSPEVKLGQAEDRRMLELALQAVPAKYREVLILKDVEDLSYEQIRAILRLPITTLKIRAVRARAMLRTELEALRR